MTTGNHVPRREFLKGVLFTGVAAGCTSKDPFTAAADQEQVKASGEMVKLLSTTGEIIEVDKVLIVRQIAQHYTNARRIKWVRALRHLLADQMKCSFPQTEKRQCFNM